LVAKSTLPFDPQQLHLIYGWLREWRMMAICHRREVGGWMAVAEHRDAKRERHFSDLMSSERRRTLTIDALQADNDGLLI
jgi:hypothetical protein